MAGKIRLQWTLWKLRPFRTLTVSGHVSSEVQTDQKLGKPFCEQSPETEGVLERLWTLLGPGSEEIGSHLLGNEEMMWECEANATWQGVWESGAKRYKTWKGQTYGHWSSEWECSNHAARRRKLNWINGIWPPNSGWQCYLIVLFLFKATRSGSSAMSNLQSGAFKTELDGTKSWFDKSRLIIWSHGTRMLDWRNRKEWEGCQEDRSLISSCVPPQFSPRTGFIWESAWEP